MDETLIIKLYRNVISCSEYSDYNLQKFENLKVEAIKFAKSHGKKLLFTVCQALDICDFDTFCEIVTDTELTAEEMDYYKNFIEEYCGDAELSRGEMIEYHVKPTIFVYSVKNLKII